MKVIKESTVGTIFEVGLIPSGSDRYACLEEPLQNFESFEMAKDFVDDLNINEYEGYDIVVVTAKKDARSPDNAWQSEVYRREGKQLNEATLNEGPISWIKNKVAKGAAKRSLANAEKEQKNARSQANAVLAKDFKKDCKDAKFYIDGNFKKAYTQDEWVRMFGDIVRNDVTSGEDYEKWYNAIVTTPDNYIIRRGAEDCSKRLEKLVPGKNDKLGDRYKIDTGDVEVEETPREEVPSEEEVPAAEATSEDIYKKFAILAKATGIKITNARGQIIKNLKTLKKINAENAGNLKVEVDGKEYDLPAYIEILKSNKLLEDVTLTEKVWKHKINSEVAFKLRDILESDETDYEALRDAMKACYDDIHAAMPEVFDEDDCNDAKEELDWLNTSEDDSDADFDDPEYMDEDDLENEWNYALEDLYDLCDSLSIWIPVRGIDESFADAAEAPDIIIDSDEVDLDDATGNIKLSKDLFDNFVPDTYLNIKFSDNNEDKVTQYKMISETDDYIVCEYIGEANVLTESTLTEAPIIKLNDTDIMNPGKVDFKQKIADATAEEEAEKARQAEEARKEQFRVKYKDVPAKLEASLGKGADAEETLEVLFEDLVPGEGAADTVAGEMVRAMMRVLYRDANDGDKFFLGYGLETCASSVAYLCSMIPVIDKHVDLMLEEAFRYVDDDEAYTKQLNQMTEEVVDHIMNNQELIFTPNEEDSRDYDYDYIEEKQPRYEFECDGSDDVCTLVNEGILTGWDLYHYVEDQLQWDNAYEGAEVERPWGYDSTSITVSNLTVEGYEQLEDSFNRNRDGWWEDLVSEHQDELDRINNGDDDYEEDDDIDEGLINARPELRPIAEKLQAKSKDLTFLANEFDKALTSEGFNYDIDIVEGFKINVKSEDLKAIDEFSHEFFKKYGLAVDIEDKGDSHNYLLKKESTKTAKQEGFLDIFKKRGSKEPKWGLFNDYGKMSYGPYDTREEAVEAYKRVTARSYRYAAELSIQEVTESLKEEFTNYEDVMQGMMDNASNEQIDADIRMFNKVAKNLGLKRPEDIVMYVDSEGMYDPVYYADSSTKIDRIIAKFNCGPVECISENRNGNVWIYFANREDAQLYINFVNSENGL